MKKIVLIGGGTVSHVRNHLALCAPAYGSTVEYLHEHIAHTLLAMQTIDGSEYQIFSYLTKMALGMFKTNRFTRVKNNFLGGSDHTYDKPLETNEDISKLVNTLIADPEVKVIIFNPALVDFDGQVGNIPSGKYAQRLKTNEGTQTLNLTPTDKIIGRIRKERKDIFVVGFKTTTNASEDEQYKAGLELLKKNSLNLVLANDTVTRKNMIIVPEEARYGVSTDRDLSLSILVEMVLARMNNTFTRSTVVDGPLVDWNSEEVPANLRAVVNHCIERGAYKPFLGKTAGHFAVKINDKQILTSVRKTNYNELDKIGLVKVDYGKKNTVIAHGAKPSVGGMSQRIIFTEHEDAECIVHFHCEPKNNIDTLAWTDPVPDDQVMGKDEISIRPQIDFECGSTQCGQNTSDGLASVNLGGGDYLKAVYLDNHGPNIVFSKKTPAEKVIRYIDKTFDLKSKTGGLVS